MMKGGVPWNSHMRILNAGCKTAVKEIVVGTHWVAYRKKWSQFLHIRLIILQFQQHVDAYRIHEAEGHFFEFWKWYLRTKSDGEYLNGWTLSVWIFTRSIHVVLDEFENRSPAFFEVPVTWLIKAKAWNMCFKLGKLGSTQNPLISSYSNMMDNVCSKTPKHTTKYDKSASKDSLKVWSFLKKFGDQMILKSLGILYKSFKTFN